jgi:hypothetical protein
MEYYLRYFNQQAGTWLWHRDGHDWLQQTTDQIPEEARTHRPEDAMSVRQLARFDTHDIELIPDLVLPGYGVDAAGYMAQRPPMRHQVDDFWRFIADHLTCRHVLHGPEFQISDEIEGLKDTAIFQRNNGLWYHGLGTGRSPVEAVLNDPTSVEACRKAFEQRQATKQESK